MRTFLNENANPRLTIHGQTDKKLGFGVSPRIHTDIQTNRKTNKKLFRRFLTKV